MNKIVRSFFGKPFAGDDATCEAHGEYSSSTRTKQPIVASLILTIGTLLLAGCGGGITGLKLDTSSRGTVCDPTAQSAVYLTAMLCSRCPGKESVTS